MRVMPMSKVFVEGKRFRIAADPTLCPQEKETCFNFLGNSRRVDVHSLHPTVVRGLLNQPEFEITELFTKTINGEETIIGVRGTLPVGSFKIGRPRQDPHLSRVFSRRARAQHHREVCPSDTDPTPRETHLGLPRTEQRTEPLGGILDV